MKIKHFLPLLLLLGSNEMLTAQEIALTPQPAHLTVKDGRFEFGNQLKAKVAPYQGDSIRMVFESFKKEYPQSILGVFRIKRNLGWAMRISSNLFDQWKLRNR